MLVVQILTRNNEKTIVKTLESLTELEAKVVVGDLGSSDSTLEICRRYGAEIKNITWSGSYSDARNSLVAEGSMNFMIEPWEVLARGHESLLSCSGNFNVNVVRKNSASKEIRIWTGLKFKNPVYESLDDDEAGFLEGVAIVASGGPDRREEARSICSKWRESRPTDADPWYYSAFSSLALGNAEEFVSFAEKYLILAGKFGPSEVQMTYRMAQIMASKKDFARAARLAAKCLALHPTFAEFWCLFGDLFMKQRKYGKARSMYENALTIGSRRPANDSHPVEIDKYKKYPQSMIRIVDEMDKNTGAIVSGQR